MLRQGRFILAALAGLGTLCPAQADEMIETRIVMHVTSLRPKMSEMSKVMSWA